jgi:hypothetical protein
MNMGLTEFALLLQGHDWQYPLSDDHRLYMQGVREHYWLHRIAGQSDDHAALYRLAADRLRHN